MASDRAGQKLSNARCTASGKVRSWIGDAWSSGHYKDVACPDCGYVGPIVWVRATMDLPPYAKTRAHKVPIGVTPSPYAAKIEGGGALHQVEATR
ncbi:Uncharacterised protein [Mycobacteroides abscessus]|uniref:Uncharacterized protein n=1 Tax=Mycobacteroides abscessus subsp. massiliense TaxID=1962118 RepID=A0AB38DM52_9MYCO|nr:Uncharacterised protein [Mycobacteroides abscessus]SKS24040.1 Uncharacterised protein [Mycobacteroides abscessus subsp. massiliense]CPS61429.1 Uncharacterised protein [Mycobacteroides abscessus]CPT16759.1 Uncharacterised protein [Mycobacteroides abscessus]CPU03929.1 Uncharacterised protein [Mycobacteroides abscessus]